MMILESRIANAKRRITRKSAAFICITSWLLLMWSAAAVFGWLTIPLATYLDCRPAAPCK